MLIASQLTGESTEAIELPRHRLSLRANFVWTFIGNVVYAVCQWGMLAVLAKLGNPQMVGQFALALAITAPVIMFTNLQTRNLQATDAKQEYDFSDYLGLRLITTAFALGLFGALVAFGGYNDVTASVILLVGLAKAFEALSDTYYGLLQQSERMDRIAISMILKGVLSLGALAAAVYVTRSAPWGVAGLALTWLVVLLAYDIPSARFVAASIHGKNTPRAASLAGLMRPRWVRANLKRLLVLGLPLGITMLLISLNTYIPRYFIEYYLGEHALGIFAAMSYVVVAESTVIMALGQATSPRLAQYHVSRNTRALWLLVLRFLALALCLAIAGVLAALVVGPMLLTLLYTNEYASYSDVFAWIMVSAGLWTITTVFGYVATARRLIRYQPLALVVIVAASIISSFALVPRYGLWGASIAMVVSAVVALAVFSLFLLAKGPISETRNEQ